MNRTGQRSDCSLIWGKSPAKYLSGWPVSQLRSKHYCTTGVTFIRSINMYSNMGYTLPRHICFDYAHCFSISSSHRGLLLQSPPNATHSVQSQCSIQHSNHNFMFQHFAFSAISCVFLYCPGQMPVWTVAYCNWFYVSPTLHFPMIYIWYPSHDYEIHLTLQFTV
jgi:hypothetical protein